MEFNNNYEKTIADIIQVETDALNSEKGQKILQKLYDEAKAENPDMTAEEWSGIKKGLLISVFRELVKENPVVEQQLGKLFEKMGA